MSARARLLCATLGALAGACAGAPDASTASVQQAVSGGEVSGPEDDFVVELVARQPEPYSDFNCNGTLLAPNLLLTALHCVTVFDVDGRFSCLTDGSLAPSPSGGWIGEPLAPENIEVYFGTTLPLSVQAHGASVLGTGSTAVCVDDIALVVLDTALPVRGVPVRLERPVVEGEELTVIGYGVNEWPDTPRARRSHVPVLDVGPDDTSHGAGTAAPRTFSVGDGPCQGDTGAPLLSDETGAVTGVFGFNFSGTCAQPGVRSSVTKLSPFASLLRRAFEVAGNEPLLETARAPVVAPGRARASCSMRAGHDQSGSLVPAIGALVFLLMRGRGTLAQRVRAPRRS